MVSSLIDDGAHPVAPVIERPIGHVERARGARERDPTRVSIVNGAYKHVAIGRPWDLHKAVRWDV